MNRPSIYLHNLAREVTAMHGCACEHVSTAYVHEMMDGKTVWKGDVEIFTLTGHLKADRAFAWGLKDAKGEIQYLAVLNLPPLLFPREAVHAAIASGEMR